MNARRRGWLSIALVLSTPVFAQSSASYRLGEQVFNAGGRPSQAVVSVSPSFRLSLDSIGEAIAERDVTSASYRLGGGVASINRPPAEVQDLEILSDGQTLTWSWEPASTTFNVYRGPLTTLPGTYGTCGISYLPESSWSDSTIPALGTSLFYLVTGENRLGQEGTKGHDSAGAERGNPLPCP